MAPLPVQAVAAPAPAIPDIVVSLRKLRLAATVRDGRLADCAVRVSSGDAAIDAAGCRAMLACVDRGVTASEPLANCIDTRVAAFVRDRAALPSDNK